MSFAEVTHIVLLRGIEENRVPQRAEVITSAIWLAFSPGRSNGVVVVVVVVIVVAARF